MEFSVSQIASMLGGEVVGDGTRKINNLGKIETAGPSDISFLSNPKYENYLYTSQAGAVIAKKGFVAQKAIHPSLILVDDPYTSFTLLLEQYHQLISFQKQGVEQPSFIGDNTEVGEGIYRGAFSYIGHQVKIGKNVKIYPNAYIGDNVSIGDNTIIYAGVKVYSKTVIGSHCVIHSGTVIGSDGFGFAPQADGTYKTIPQLGNVIIEDNVDIGANTVIDCATMGSTVIRKGVKLDNLIQIAHNVEVGKNTVVAAQAGISGSAKVGENCVVAGQVGIVGHLQIANKTTIAAQSGISKTITEEGTVWMGSPAFDHGSYLKTYAAFKKLPDLVKQLRALEEKVLNLPASLKNNEY